MGGLRRIGLVVIAGLACAATVAALRAWTPAPTEYGLRAKLTHFKEHRDEVDLVYLGSSRVFRSFVPEVIDAELEARGHEIRSLNLGIPGMGDFEVDWMLREVLNADPERLRFVVLEPGLFDPRIFSTANHHSPRSLGWHATRGTRAVLEATALADLEEAERRRLSRDHIEAWLRHSLNLGQGRRILSLLLRGDADADEHGLHPQVLARGHGYLALEEHETEEVLSRRAHFLGDPEGHALRAARIEPARLQRPSLDRYPLGVLLDQIEAIRSAGAEPIFVLPPSSSGRSIVLSLADAGHLPVLLDFNSPAKHPELFRSDARFDRNHLTAAAAVEFSRLFAARLADELDRQ